MQGSEEDGHAAKNIFTKTVHGNYKHWYGVVVMMYTWTILVVAKHA